MRYRIHEFEFDPDRGLSLDGEAVPLEPQALGLLRFLVANRGRIISKDELIDTLWDGRAVSDAALTTQVRSVRRAFGDDAAAQKFLRTHPKRGIELVAPVEQVAEAPEPGRARRAIGACIAATAALALALPLFWREADGALPAPSLSIAVLPFENLSGDPAQDYIADAFTEDLITDLSRIQDAFVISRSTMFTYRGTGAEAAGVARDLGVHYVLEGSVRLDGDTARINAQLIDGETNAHLWSDRFDREASDLFSVQDNVTGQIASVLSAELRQAEFKRQDPQAPDDAWKLALQGNVILYNHQSVSDYQDAYRLLTASVEKDPTISYAWSGLSFVHYVASVARIPGLSRPDSAELSLETALRAAETDSGNAEAFWLIGAGYARVGQPERGMTACEMAMRLNPNMDCGHVCAGLVSMSLERPQEAADYFEHALRLNPRFRPFTKQKYLGLAHLQAGDRAGAAAAFNAALAGAPKDSFAILALAAVTALEGDTVAAQRMVSGAIDFQADGAPTAAALKASHGWMGSGVDQLIKGLSLIGLREA